MARLIRRFGFLLQSWTAVLTSIAVLSAFSQSERAADLFGNTDPVVTPLIVESVDSYLVRGVEGSRIKGRAVILRPECNYEGVRWRLHRNGRSVRATAYFSDPPIVREKGLTRWDALIVGVSPEKLAATTGEVIHDCGWYDVHTPFFIPETSLEPL